MSRYALPLSGYDNASVWGHDARAASYYAQMWRNTSDSWNDPDIWLSGTTPISSPLRLAEMISARTGAGMADVLRAMAASNAPEAQAHAGLAQQPQ
jgi:hypothetical protein